MARRFGSGFRSGGYYDRFPAPSKPIEVEGGGIKARSKRGEFVTSWWGKRWVEVIHKFLDSGRLSRGRTYARKGQVTNLDIMPGEIRAKVQGSRKKPYDVTITLDVLEESKWKEVAALFSKDASLTAMLLNGQLPQEADTLFEKLKVSIIPATKHQIELDCTCPDWSTPCKHSAAVIYLVGEELDRDPFLLFLLRGKSRDEFMEMLGTGGGADEQAEEGLPLPMEHNEFWAPFDPLAQQKFSFEEPRMDAVLVRRLGPFPFWQGEGPFLETMETLYRQGVRHAGGRYFNENDEDQSDTS
ncbi:MAG: SWIM zinc finger family protein [Candidatus Sumerlaeia bacterium]|nr:SWIM zinc finger family protein [Candidatus Sumerlaeia bacterium]